MPKNRALLLDRDGVINEDTGYVGFSEQFRFLPGIFPFLREARALGFRLAILTNQAGVAKGHYTENDYTALTAFMLERLGREGIEIELVLAAFAHPKGVRNGYIYQSFWRKPNPGMVLEALRRLDADPLRSAFLGDALTDMQAALNGGVARRLWLAQDPSPPPEGVERVKDYSQTLEILTSFIKDPSA